MTADDPRAGTPAPHPGDALSALLDGELGDVDAAAARHHLAGCPTCEAELAVTSQARSSLRGLPPVEPPAGFIEGLIAGSVPERNAGSVPERNAGSVPERNAGSVPERNAGSVSSSSHDATVTPIGEAPSQRRRWRAGVAAMSACAAVTVVVLGVAAPHDPPASPPLGRFIVAHETEVGAGDPVSELATAVVPVGFQR